MNDKISSGQRQRLLLGLALINDPTLIFLDEPSTGLDPQSRINVWHIIREAVPDPAVFQAYISRQTVHGRRIRYLD